MFTQSRAPAVEARSCRSCCLLPSGPFQHLSFKVLWIRHRNVGDVPVCVSLICLRFSPLDLMEQATDAHMPSVNVHHAEVRLAVSLDSLDRVRVGHHPMACWSIDFCDFVARGNSLIGFMLWCFQRKYSGKVWDCNAIHIRNRNEMALASSTSTPSPNIYLSATHFEQVWRARCPLKNRAEYSDEPSCRITQNLQLSSERLRSMFRRIDRFLTG